MRWRLLSMALVFLAALSAESDPPIQLEAGPRRDYPGLRAPEAAVRRAAVQALAAQPPVERAAAVPFLLLALEDESPEVRTAASEEIRSQVAAQTERMLASLEELDRLGTYSPWPELVRLRANVTPMDYASAVALQGRDRVLAARILMLVGLERPQTMSDPLTWVWLLMGTNLLSDADEPVRTQAAVSLVARALFIARTADRRHGVKQSSLSVALANADRVRLVTLLRSPKEATRAAAALTVAILADPHVEVASALLGGHEGVLSPQAALALTVTGGIASVPVERLHNAQSTVDPAVLLAAGKRDLVVSDLASADTARRTQSLRALLEHGERGEQVLAGAVSHLERLRPPDLLQFHWSEAMPALWRAAPSMGGLQARLSKLAGNASGSGASPTWLQAIRLSASPDLDTVRDALRPGLGLAEIREDDTRAQVAAGAAWAAWLSRDELAQEPEATLALAPSLLELYVTVTHERLYVEVARGLRPGGDWTPRLLPVAAAGLSPLGTYSTRELETPPINADLPPLGSKMLEPWGRYATLLRGLRDLGPEAKPTRSAVAALSSHPDLRIVHLAAQTLRRLDAK